MLAAGIEYLDAPTLQKLQYPRLRPFKTDLYSNEAPIIHCLDQCKAFRERDAPQSREIVKQQ